MRTKLITALRIAANKLENNEFDYRWNVGARCNCGVVACALLGTSSHELDKRLRRLSVGGSDEWRKRVGTFCSVTGMQTESLFAELEAAGLTPSDIVQLEYLSNPEVRARMPKFTSTRTVERFFRPPIKVKEPIKNDFKYKQVAIIYLREWAKLIEEQERDDVPVSTPKEEAVAS